MVGNILAWLVLVLVTVGLGWLAVRAFRSRNGLVKWLGGGLSGLMTVLLGLVSVVALVGWVKLYAPGGHPVSAVQVARTPEQIARGEKFAQFCAACHSPTGQPPLAGGMDNFGHFPGGPTIGTLYPPNLTPAGELAEWSDGEVIRAIREGIGRDGQSLIIMPSETFRYLSDADVQAIVAYLRSQPASGDVRPENDLNLLGAVFIGAGLFPTSAQPAITRPITAPPQGPTADYGLYLISVSGCRVCHGPSLTGGAGPGPAGPNLAALVPHWTEAQFINTIRTGIDPSGHELAAKEMPWRQLSAEFSDNELRAIYLVLHNLGPATAP